MTSPVRPGRRTRALHRLLLRGYPPSFRRRFGDAAREDLARWLAEERPGGGAWAGAGRVLRDFVRSWPSAWRDAWRGARRDPAGGGGAATITGRGEGTMGATWSTRLGGVWRDARYAVRSLSRDRLFTAGTVAVVAVAIAGSVGVFSVVNAYLLRPMPYPEADRLVAVDPVVPVSWNEAEDLFEIPLSWDLDALTLVDGDRPELVTGAWVSPGFFEAFGIRPALGRGFEDAEAGPGAASVVVISHALWQRRYGGDPGVLGRAVPAFSSDRPEDAETFTVVGVLPEDFWFHNGYTEVLMPLRADNPVYMARLRPGQSPEDAARRLEERARAAGAELEAGRPVRFGSFQDRYTRGVRPTLVLLGIAVSLVLLIACGNAAVLLLVRAAGREREMGVRQALGAGRGRLARQLTVEGLVLAASAGVAGVAGAHLALGALAEPIQLRLGTGIPGGAGALRIDGTVVAAALGATLLTALLFTVVPLAASLRSGVAARLSGSGRAVTDTRARRRVRGFLVAGELALSLALLVSAGLAVRSARNAATLDLGFDPRNVWVAEVNVRGRSYPEAAERLAFFRRLADEARALPAVRAAGLTLRTPFTWNFNPSPVEGEQGAAAPAGRADAVGMLAGPGYFEAMGTPVLRGRAFERADAPGAPLVAVVSAGLAERLWPGRDPLGRRIREVARNPGPDSEPLPWRTVVGVVPDVRKAVGREHAPDYYLPVGQLTPTSMALVVRTRDGAGSPLPDVAEALQGLDPSVALVEEGSLEAATVEATRPSRFLAWLLAGFSVFAVVLAVVGLYAVVAYAASHRARDVAIRMALGADGGRVASIFLREGLLVVGGGLVVGLLGARALAGTLESRLVEVSSTDPWTYAALAALLAAVAATATWIPARSAARTDPMAVLRGE